MIKTFKKYTDQDLLDANITFGDNPIITDSVIFNNPHNIILGKNVRIDHGCILVASKNTKIIIGDNTHINAYCSIHANDANVEIGKEVDIGIYTVIFTTAYDFTKEFPRNFKQTGPVYIKDNSIIGPSNTILPNVVIGEHSAVGTNSFVKTNVLPYTVVGGTPTRLLKNK